MTRARTGLTGAGAGLERTEVGAARIGGNLVGGCPPPSTTTAAVERYDIRRDGWRRIRPMPVAALAARDGRLYADVPRGRPR